MSTDGNLGSLFNAFADVGQGVLRDERKSHRRTYFLACQSMQCRRIQIPPSCFRSFIASTNGIRVDQRSYCTICASQEAHVGSSVCRNFAPFCPKSWTDILLLPQRFWLCYSKGRAWSYWIRHRFTTTKRSLCYRSRRWTPERRVCAPTIILDIFHARSCIPNRSSF